MTFPSTLAAFIGSVICFVAVFACWAFLAGISWVDHLDLDAKPCRFVGDELRELIERPTVEGAVVFTGFCPTTCACRALSDAVKGFYSDCPYTLSVGIVDDLARDLVVGILHPAAFLVLGPLDGFLLFEVLQLLPASIELAALVSHLSTIAVEPSRLTSDIGHCWNLDACVHSHDDLTLLLFYVW